MVASCDCETSERYPCNLIMTCVGCTNSFAPTLLARSPTTCVIANYVLKWSDIQRSFEDLEIKHEGEN